MKVAICSPYSLMSVSGVSVFVRELSERLTDLGHEVEVFTPAESSVIARLPRGLRNVGLSLWTFWRLVSVHDAWTAVHANQPHLQSGAAVLASRIRAARAVVTYHSSVPPSQSPISDMTQRLSAWFIARAADDVVFVSDATRNEYSRTRGIVIRIGVDLPRLQAVSVRRSATDGHPFTFTFVGRQTTSKGFFDVLGASQRLARSEYSGKFRIRLVGETPPNEQQERSRWLAALGSCVDDYGPLHDHVSTLRVIAESDALLLPSYREGFPLVVLEAMALGCLAIVSPVGGLPEVVKDHETGLFVPPGNLDTLEEAMKWALSHPTEVKTIREQATKAIRESMDITTTFNAYLELYGKT